MGEVNFFREDTKFNLRQKALVVSWLKKVANREDAKIRSVNYIFCSDNYLFKLNVGYLKHRTLTDIITFDHSETPGLIEGDIFISVDRVRDNAAELNTPFNKELFRVIIHGLLHLLGYTDKTSQQKSAMRLKEDEYLTFWEVPRGTTRRTTMKRST